MAGTRMKYQPFLLQLWAKKVILLDNNKLRIIGLTSKSQCEFLQ